MSARPGTWANALETLNARVEPSVTRWRWLSWLVLSTCLVVLGSNHLRIIASPLQADYREGAIPMSTQLLLDGGNPFSIEYQPEYTNTYGILYHLVVYPFARVFGATFQVHRAVSGFCIAFACALFVMALRSERLSWFLASAGGTLLYSQLLSGTTPLARPDSLGFSLFLASVVLPLLAGFSIWALSLGVVLGVLGFLAKPYFVLSIPLLVSYVFLFRSKRDGLIAGALAALLLSGTVWLVSGAYATYFDSTFFLYDTVVDHSFVMMAGQLRTYMKEQFPLVLLAVLCGLVAAIGLAREGVRRSASAGAGPRRAPVVRLGHSRKPLLEADISLMTYAFWIMLALFCLKFGLYAGNWMAYLYHLVSPFFIYTAFRLARSQAVTSLLAVLMSVSALQLAIGGAAFRSVPAEDWSEIEQFVASHARIYNSPALTSVLFREGRRVYDSGLSEYFGASGLRSDRLARWFPENAEILARDKAFRNEVEEALAAQDFDAVVLTQGLGAPYISRDKLESTYEFKQTLVAPMLLGTWKLDVWEPKSVVGSSGDRRGSLGER